MKTYRPAKPAPAKHTRIAGHAATYEFGNGVVVKPRCRCGWTGKAQPPSSARVQYRAHLQSVRATIAKAEGRA